MQLHLITGQGGAGKTTLLQGLCERARPGEPTALLQTGERLLDAALLARAGWEAADVPGLEGRAPAQAALVAALAAALAEVSRGARFARLLVEVPATVDPEALLAQLESNPAVAARFSVDVCFTVIDSRAGPPAEPAQARRFGAQVRAADLVLLNHCDHSDELRIAAIEVEVRRRSPRAAILRTARCALDLSPVLRSPSEWPPGLASDDFDLPVDVVSTHPRFVLPAGHEPTRALSVEFCAWRYDAPLRTLRYAALLELMERLPAGVIRAEGSCHTERGAVTVRARPSRVALSPGRAQGVSLVFVGTHFDPELLRATLSAAAHREDG